MRQASFDDLARCLNGDQVPRVWSLLVTVFGELGQDPNARLSVPLLGKLMDLAGVKPGAMRVALHRLKKDEWIDSQRCGRSSEYFLTPYGRSQSVEASPRIYSSTPQTEDAWLVITNPADPTIGRYPSGVWLTPNILITGQRPGNGNAFSAYIGPGAALPDWMAKKLCNPSIIEFSDSLATRFSHVLLSMKNASMPDPLERAVLRVLIVHSWRRIALKAPMLPDHIFPEPWRGATCRKLLGELLALLRKPELAELQGCISA